MAYKNVTINSTTGSISDAISELESLGSECREIVDNASEGLSQTQRIQTLGESADALEGVQEPDIPDFLSDLPITYTEQQLGGKKRGSESRVVRCSNACVILSACIEAIENFKSDAEDQRIALDEDATDFDSRDDELNEQIEACDTAVQELQEIIDNCESLDFPGMFG